MSTDRNLLVGILAVQMSFVSKDDLVAAMNAWLLAKHRPLSELLQLTPERRTLLEALVAEHLKLHGDDVQKSLAAISSVESVRNALAQVDDADVQASIGSVSDGTIAQTSPHYTQDATLRFRIVRPHAKGGLGEVFVAHDSELRRQVALKEIQKRHADNANSRGRFILEAEVTGGLEHPNIVPVYGLGSYGDGRPFYAMRFIKGDSLKDAIEKYHGKTWSSDAERNIAFRNLLKRFVDVCNAIAYAHSRGVLHRDLKPANIMLGNYGETLVVDWGLAKSLASPVSAGAESDEPPLTTTCGSYEETQAGSAVGTPPFMSPEQAAGKLDQLGSAADVYSLGATLYVLLTNQMPFHGSVGEILAKVQAGDFPAPKQAKSDVPAALNMVVLRAMAKRPQDRYSNAALLGEEVEHYLADEPVMAFREPFSVRGKRWARKHPGTVAGLAASLIVGLLGLGGGLYFVNAEKNETELARQAEAERAEGERLAKLDAESKRQAAETNLAYSRKANTILASIFDNLDPKANFASVADFRNKLNANLDKAVRDLDGSAIGDPLEVAKIQMTLGDSLLGMGETSKAIGLYQKALATRAARLGPDHPDTLMSMGNLASGFGAAGRLTEALRLYEESLTLKKAKLGPEHPETLASMNNLANGYLFAGRFAKALPLLEETYILMKATLGPDHPKTLASMNNLGDSYQSVGRLADALRLFEETLKRMKAKLGPDHPDTLTTMGNLAYCYCSADRLTEGLTLYKETIMLQKAKLGTSHPSTLISMSNLANGYQSAGRLVEALALYEETLKLTKAKLGSGHPDTLMCKHNLAFGYHAAGRFTEAVPLLEETLIQRKAKLGPDHPSTLMSLNNLASVYQITGRLDEALPLFEETLKRNKAKLGPDHIESITSMDNLAATYESMGRLSESLPLSEVALKLRIAKLGPDHSEIILSKHNLAYGYQSAGRMTEALPLFTAAVKGLEKIEYQSGQASGIISNATVAFEAARQWASAEEWRRKWAAHLKATAGAESMKYASELVLLGANLIQQHKWPEAEATCRECLNILRTIAPDSWNRYNIESMLGEALARQKKNDEAEKLLLSGYEGMKQRESTIPPGSNILYDAVARLIAYSDGNPTKQKEWQAKLPTEFAPRPRKKIDITRLTFDEVMQAIEQRVNDRKALSK